MTEYMNNKLSNFIDNLIELKLEDIELDIHTGGRGKNKKYYYSIDLDLNIPAKVNFNHGVKFNQTIHICVCPQTGLILFFRSDFDEYRDIDLDFAKKYSEIIQDLHNKKQCDILDNLIDQSYTDLKMNRDINIKKLIG